jgi:hypothetical protein
MKIQRDIFINVKMSSCEAPLIPVGFQLNFSFIDKFSKKTKMSNLIKFHPLGVKFFLADGRTDMMKLMIVFRNFVNAPKTEGVKRRIEDRAVCSNGIFMLLS